MLRISCLLSAALIAHPVQTNSAPKPGHLQIAGAAFLAADEPFQWRGISAFRLVEMVARGNQAQAAAFLDWASSRKLTVVRVFAMARHLFPLTPAEGIRALPELLDGRRARIAR